MGTAWQAKGDTFIPDKPRQWAPTQIIRPGNFMSFDLAPDGKRFIAVPIASSEFDDKGSVHVTFLLNFFDELKRRVR